MTHARRVRFCGLMNRMSRVGLAVVWLIAVTFAAGVALVGYTLASGPVVAPQPMSIERLPATRHDPNPWARWSVTEQIIAHHVLIATVETRYLGEARAITRQIVDPIKSNYAEILIYFHRPGRPDLLAPRRVQWTPRGGYVETIFVPNEELRTKN